VGDFSDTPNRKRAVIADEPEEFRNVMGRPKAEIDLEMVRNAAKIGCTLNEIAAVMGISRSTMYKHMGENPDIQIAIDEGRDMGCGTLRRYQWHKAEAGSDTMLIWLGKNMLGQKDKTELSGDAANPVRVLVELVGEQPEPKVIEHEPRETGSRLSDETRNNVVFIG